MKPDEPARKKPTSFEIAEARQRVYDGQPYASDADLLSDFIGDMFTHLIEQDRTIEQLNQAVARVRKIHHLQEWVSLSDVCIRHHGFRQVEPNPESIAVADVCPDCRPKRYMACVCGETDCEILAALEQPEEGNHG